MQGNHTAGAPESAGAEDAGTVEGSSEKHSFPYFDTQRSVPVAFAVLPGKEVHNYAGDCKDNDELRNHAHEFATLIYVRLASALFGASAVPGCPIRAFGATSRNTAGAAPNGMF